MEKFRGTIGEFAAQRKRDFMTSFQENILLDSNFNRPEDYDAVVTDMVRRGDYWPIILGTHKSHPAGFPLIEEAAYLQKLINPYLPPTDQIRGSLLLIANTMENGQSDDIVEGLKRVQPIFSKNNTETLPVLRKKDAKHLNEDLKREYRNKLFTKTGQIVTNGQIPLLLPEATVESGRQKPGGAPGDIKGMVYLETDSISFLASMIRRQSREPLLFFVGTTGENTIYDPISEKVTTEAHAIAAGRAIPPLRKIIHPPMRAVVDYPTPYHEIEEAFGENGRVQSQIVDWYCGERLAQLLPFHERGVFDEVELLHDPHASHILRRDTRNLF